MWHSSLTIISKNLQNAKYLFDEPIDMFQQSPESNLFSHVWCRISEGSYRQIIDEFQTKISEKTKFNQRFIYFHGNSSVLEQWNSFVSYFLNRAIDTVQDNYQGPILHNESTLQFQEKKTTKKNQSYYRPLSWEHITSFVNGVPRLTGEILAFKILLP